MPSRFKPPQRRAIMFLGSLWVVAIVFLVVRAVVPG